MIVSHDPFKSDIYSLGIVFLELTTIGILSRDEFKEIVNDKDKLVELIDKTEFNLISQEQFEYIQIENGIFLKIPNVLKMMLSENEDERAGILELCSLFQLKNCLESKYSTHLAHILQPKITEISGQKKNDRIRNKSDNLQRNG